MGETMKVLQDAKDGDINAEIKTLPQFTQEELARHTVIANLADLRIAHDADTGKTLATAVVNPDELNASDGIEVKHKLLPTGAEDVENELPGTAETPVIPTETAKTTQVI